MSSDPADFKYTMICKVSSVTFLYFHPSASFFSLHLDFINSTPSDFLSQDKIFLKHTFFLKAEVKNHNKAILSLWFYGPLICPPLVFSPFLSATGILLDGMKEPFSMSLPLIFFKYPNVWVFKILSSHYWWTKSLKCYLFSPRRTTGLWIWCQPCHRVKINTQSLKMSSWKILLIFWASHSIFFFLFISSFFSTHWKWPFCHVSCLNPLYNI